MKLKKIGAVVIGLVLLVGSGTTNVTYAMEQQEELLVEADYQEVIPFWTSIADISPYLSVDGNILYPEVYIKAKSSSGSISGMMYLEKYTYGSWTTVTSWSLKGTSSVFLSKTYRGTSGTKYRTRIVVTVDGEKAEVTSRTCEI